MKRLGKNTGSSFLTIVSSDQMEDIRILIGSFEKGYDHRLLHPNRPRFRNHRSTSLFAYAIDAFYR